MRNKGRVLTRTLPLERVWDFHFDPKTSVVETHVSRLRAKVDKPFDTELTETVRGIGYSIYAPSELKYRTAIRLALACSAIFAVTVTAVFGLLYLSLTSSLKAYLRQRVLEARESFIRIDRAQDFPNFVQIVAREAASVRDADSIILLGDDRGRYLAGNIRDAAAHRAQRPRHKRGGRGPRARAHPWTASGRARAGRDGDLSRPARATPDQRPVRDALRHRRRQDHAHVPVQDISNDLDQVAAQVNRTLDELQGMIERVNQASSDIAHDLKHPVGRLRQMLDSACASAKTSDEFRAAISQALTEIDTIVETFEVLLQITQIEAGAGKKRLRRLNLVSVLRDVADVYAAVIEVEGRRFEARFDPSHEVTVKGDRESLIQLFANLTENAIRHCPEGTLIALDLVFDGGRAIALVCDTGPGIPEGERVKVFRRLYRLEKSRSTPGSALGLSLVAAMARLHDATVERRDNKPGLCAMISFPIAARVSKLSVTARRAHADGRGVTHRGGWRLTNP